MPAIKGIPGYTLSDSSRTMLQYTRLENVEPLSYVTPDFISPGQCLPNSSIINLKPVDYKIWVVIWQNVYKTDIDVLRKHDAN